ncbi:competence protein ComK [Alkalihalobacillus sp. MEB130]|uniref:competence protein ComK n=1 Tax=Alkalihalobacillus sp. MEB130 TaxID=2976704 RepID=UPI0028DF3F45|nr:competence protein ComK [Alkalihalobacillus sp. MEB130]MDT8863006.1 competence protein ComK [Alkalihalobacillus sp. MEB130]
MKIVNEYLINKGTMLIEPTFDEFGQLHSFVTEEYTSYLVKKSPLTVVDDSCFYYGSSFHGRLDASEKITGDLSKIPICISEANRIFFFPLESPHNNWCHWVSHYHVSKIRALGPKLSTIYFNNEISIDVPYERGGVDCKLAQTAQFRYIMLRRWEMTHKS